MPKIAFEEEKYLTDKGKRNINILEVLRRYGPISRPEISSKVGMNVVTISHDHLPPPTTANRNARILARIIRSL